MAFYAFGGAKTKKAVDYNLEKSKTKGMMILGLSHEEHSHVCYGASKRRLFEKGQKWYDNFSETELGSRS